MHDKKAAIYIDYTCDTNMIESDVAGGHARLYSISRFFAFLNPCDLRVTVLIIYSVYATLHILILTHEGVEFLSEMYFECLNCWNRICRAYLTTIRIWNLSILFHKIFR